MGNVTFTPEQFDKLLEVLFLDLFVFVFFAVISALFAWDAISFFIGRFLLILKSRSDKRKLANNVKT